MDFQNKPMYFMKKDIWQRSFKFGIRIIKMTERIPQGNTSWILSKQIVRSGTSIAANIAEGSGSSSKKEFIRYINIAKKSALETYNWLLLIEENFNLNNQMIHLKDENEQIIKILYTIVLNAKQNK